MTCTFRTLALTLVFLMAIAVPQSATLSEVMSDWTVRADVSLAAPAGAPLQSVDDDDDHHGMWGDWDGWGWIFMIPMMLLFWGGLIWLVVWLVRGSGRDASTRYDDPLEIARRRYARGEISSEELEQIGQHLRR